MVICAAGKNTAPKYEHNLFNVDLNINDVKI